ncbi:STAS domain-containing protein [Nonomuraea sp. NPDC050783]|uniref:STAS domain-containing protein n=1 Tax=Nonomuraea sp. NPDC050783 TaxID=3154634 RepID=UPI00346564E8
MRDPMPPLLTHHEHHPGATVITLAGEIDLASAPGLHRFIAQVRRRPDDHLIFDMAAVTFMDSMGLRVLLEAFTVAERHGGAIHLAALNGPPARLVTITRLGERVHLHDNTGQALAAVAAAAAGEIGDLPGDGSANDGSTDDGPVNGGPVNGGPVNGGPVNGGPVNGGPVNGGPVNGGSANGGSSRAASG